MPNNQQSATKPHSVYLYVVLGASLFAFIQTFALLSPILLSFLLIFLISLAFNPVISRLRALTGGRRGATGLIVAALLMVIALTGWAFFGPLQNSVTKLSEQLPAYWERLQKPLIKMEQQAVLSEQKLQAEVTTEIAQTAAVEGKAKPETVKPVIKPVPSQNDERAGLFSFQLKPDAARCGWPLHGGGVQRGSDSDCVGDGLLWRDLYADQPSPHFWNAVFSRTRASP